MIKKCYTNIFISRGLVPVLFLLCLGISNALGQKAAYPDIVLRNGVKISGTPNAQQWLDSMNAAGWKPGPVQAVLRFAQKPNATQQAALAKAGILLEDALPGNNYISIIGKQAGAGTLPLIPLSIIPVKASWKVIEFPEQANGSEREVLVAFFSTVTIAEMNEAIGKAGGRLLTSPLAANYYYEVAIPESKIPELAGWYGVKSISPAAHDQSLNFESVTATKTNLAQLSIPNGGYGLLGDGMTIGVGDNTSGVNHVDLRDRIVNYNPAPYTNHGMHINGITGGAGTMLPRGQGFAPHATILDHLYNLVWARTGTMVQTHNMTVTNNSYAAIVGNCNYSGVYDAYAQALDTLALQYPQVLHVFASGNDGNMTCAPYPPKFGTTTGGYQPAKNILVVGQTDKRYEWGNGSSRGPVKDGRIKPEITAIGTEVTSTHGGDDYLTAGGTSMASPQVAGAALLLEQRYKQLHSNANAPSDLIKTLLMNGAMDIGNPGPDFTFGFGMMDMYRSLQMLDSNHHLSASVGDGALQNHVINVPANTGQLKVMLYWHDPPASIIAGRQLVNDLDIEVTAPAGNTTLPMVLNASPANVDDVAIPGVDRLNNVEQVIIYNPPAGNYTIKVKGYDVSGNAQPYVVAYDVIKTGVMLTYPSKGAAVNTTDSLRIYWDASPDIRNFTLEVSADNGATWSTIDNNIPAQRRWYTWHPLGISSNQCMMRLTRNGAGQLYTSGAFVMNPAPLLSLGAVQCPGYMNITWNAVPNATSYQVMRKKGPYLQNEIIVTDTSYTFKSLSLDSTYYAAVVPLINGTPGYRSAGISRRPNNGTCAGAISDGDLMAESIEAPLTGRQATSTQLGASQNITMLVRNLDDVPANSYRVSYSLNGGTWQSQIVATNIPANANVLITIPAGLNMSAAGSYILRVAVTNLAATDAVKGNDTLVKIIRQLINAPLNLATPFTDGFENSGAFSLTRDSLGFTPNERWDFFNSTDTGRLRTFVNNDIVITGNRSISLDVLQYAKTNTNFLTGTFNTSGYNTASSEIRFEFDYKLHDNPRRPDSNKVWVRGSDVQPWTALYSYDLNAEPGSVNQSGTLSITDALIAGGQNFSSSMQVRFGQKDSTVIALNDYGAGLTLDNVKLYTVANDLAVDSILSPNGAACNFTSSPVSVRLYNGVAQTLNNIQVAYQVDNSPVVTATIASLAGKTSMIYTFSQQLTGITAGPHTIKVWAIAAGDTYAANDTLTTIFRNQPLIASFPYLENFENNDGYFFTEGMNNSWQYGTPAGASVQNAASGTKAWKTSLAGYHNDNEQSYLYSPCYDLSGLTNPMLSFSGILDIEDCGNTICDAAWMEYTTNGGTTWTKLGASGQGYGWYNNDTAQVWSRQGATRWTVRSIPLPVSTQPVQLRFVLKSDPGTARNGISVDDVHIFNKEFGVYSGADAGPVTHSLSGSQFSNYVQNGQLIAQINPDGQNPGNTAVNVYVHAAADTADGQYYLPRSFMVNSAQQPSDSVTARFYILDKEVDTLVKATGCAQCTKPADAYRLGISKYDDSNQSNENGILSDNVSGVWKFYNTRRVKWVPYDSGYYVEVRVPSFSEFWFNDGGPLGNLSLPVYPLNETSLIGVYPNPSTDGRLSIVWSAGLERSIDISLTDLTGRLLKQESFVSRNGRNVSVLNTGILPDGIYFLRCKIGDRLFVQKVLFR